MRTLSLPLYIDQIYNARRVTCEGENGFHWPYLVFSTITPLFCLSRLPVCLLACLSLLSFLIVLFWLPRCFAYWATVHTEIYLSMSVSSISLSVPIYLSIYLSLFTIYVCSYLSINLSTAKIPVILSVNSEIFYWFYKDDFGIE